MSRSDGLKVLVSIQKPYGAETIYPENETARFFCALLKQKTLTREDIEGIRALGFSIEVVVPEAFRGLFKEER
jgi:hypothetical protein